MVMPAYNYRPEASTSTPVLRSRNQMRARAFAGGTFFRSRDSGVQSNNISVEIIGTKLVVTNHNTAIGENVTGPVEVIILEQSLDWRERYTIENLTTAPRARKYSISLQIGATLAEELGVYDFSTILHIPDKLSALVKIKQSEVTPTSVITFKARTRVYDLVTISRPLGGGYVGGLDPDALRTAVNANDPWIEMPIRSGRSVKPDGTLGPAPAEPYDVWDTGGDGSFLTPFPKTFLSGGDGFPPNPDMERTGPTRSLLHINQGEAPNGVLVELNKMYEWSGDSRSAGSWTNYKP